MKRKARTKRVGSGVVEYRSVYSDIDRTKSRVIHLLGGDARSVLLQKVAVDVSVGWSRIVGNSMTPSCKYTIESELCHRARRAAAVREPAGQPSTIQFCLYIASFGVLSGRVHSEVRDKVSAKFRLVARTRTGTGSAFRATVNGLVSGCMLGESQEE